VVVLNGECAVLSGTLTYGVLGRYIRASSKGSRFIHFHNGDKGQVRG